jgi:hypothetical protein
MTEDPISYSLFWKLLGQCVLNSFTGRPDEGQLVHKGWKAVALPETMRKFNLKSEYKLALLALQFLWMSRPWSWYSSSYTITWGTR